MVESLVQTTQPNKLVITDDFKPTTEHIATPYPTNSDVLAAKSGKVEYWKGGPINAAIPPAPSMTTEIPPAPSSLPLVQSSSTIPPAPAALPVASSSSSIPEKQMSAKEYMRIPKKHRFRKLQSSLTQRANDQVKSTVMRSVVKTGKGVTTKLQASATQQSSKLALAAQEKIVEVKEAIREKIDDFQTKRREKKLHNRQELMAQVDNKTVGVYETSYGEQIPVRLTKSGSVKASEKLKVKFEEGKFKAKEEVKALGIKEIGKQVIKNVASDLKDAAVDIAEGLKEDLRDAVSQVKDRAKLRYMEKQPLEVVEASAMNNMEMSLRQQQALLKRERKREKRRQRRLEKKLQKLQLRTMEAQQSMLQPSMSTVSTVGSNLAPMSNLQQPMMQPQMMPQQMMPQQMMPQQAPILPQQSQMASSSMISEQAPMMTPSPLLTTPNTINITAPVDQIPVTNTEFKNIHDSVQPMVAPGRTDFV